MKFKELAEDWKRIGLCITVAGTIAASAIGAELHFAKAADVKQLQMNQNYSNYQARLLQLTGPYTVCCNSEGRYYVDHSKMPKNVYQQIQWLQAEITKLEKQMGLRK